MSGHEGDIPKALIRLNVNGPIEIGDQKLAEGSLILPNGKKHAVRAVVEPRASGVFFPMMEIDLKATNPGGRPHEDGRRMAVAIVYRLLTEQFGLGIGAARDKAGEILGYEEGVGGNRPKTVKNVLKEARTVGMMEQYPILAALIPDEGITESSAMLLMPGATANERGEITGHGWVWYHGWTEAIFGDIQPTMEA